MLGQHFVRVGALGSVGRFVATGAERYPRGARVICRTSRGLEVGEVLSASDIGDGRSADGALLRRVTTQDDLLLARLDKNRDEAFQACVTRLAERGLSAVLVDVEHLFDGQSLYFYFLGEPPPEAGDLTAELAAVYESRAQLQKFADTLAAGCGPHCGTDEAAGCGTSGGCSICAVGCAVASAAKPH